MRVRKWKKNVQLDFLTQISNVALIERSIQYYSSVEKRDQAESTRLWSLAVSQTFIKFSRSLLSEFSCIARLIKALSCVVCGSIMVWILCKSLLRGELPSRCWRHSFSHREENPEIRKWLFISLTHVIRPWGTEHRGSRLNFFPHHLWPLHCGCGESEIVCWCSFEDSIWSRRGREEKLV